MENNVNLIKIGSRDLYKAVKNYLVHDFELNKKIDTEYVRTTVESYIKKEVEKYFKQTQFESMIHRLIKNEIARIISAESGTYTKNFDTTVTDLVKSTIQAELTKKLSVSVKYDDGNVDPVRK